MLDPKQLETFVRIVNRGGTVVCNAATRKRLMKCAGELSSEVWSTVRFRISPHMKDGKIAAISHDGATPTDLTDAS
jgi:precorrin-6B methylase 2